MLVVDGIQSAGAQVMNVEADGIDVLSCGGFKWLQGLAGTGFLYTNARARRRISPVFPGMFAAEHSFTELQFYDDGRQYETGSLGYSLFHGWQAGLGVLAEVGIANIQARNLELTDQIIAGLKSLGLTIKTPHEHPGERSAIVAFTMGSAQKNKAMAERLEAQGVLISHRGESLRVSPNFYNTNAEVDQFLSGLEAHEG